MNENKVWKSGSFITAYILIGIILVGALPSFLLRNFPDKRVEILNDYLQKEGLFEGLEGVYVGMELPEDGMFYEMGFKEVWWLNQDRTIPVMYPLFYNENRGMDVIFERYPTNIDEWRLVGFVIHRKSYAMNPIIS